MRALLLAALLLSACAAQASPHRWSCTCSNPSDQTGWRRDLRWVGPVPSHPHPDYDRNAEVRL